MLFYWIGQLVNRPRLLRRLKNWMLSVPRTIVFLLITLIGLFIYIWAHGTRDRIIRNMGELMPHLSRSKHKRMCRQYLVHECLTIYEQTIEYERALTLQGRSKARFQFDGLEHLDEALKLGRGAIVYTPHIGNYFYHYWILSQKYNCLSVVTAGSEELRNLFIGMHSTGVKAYDYDDMQPLDLIRSLRTHLRDNGVLFILGDFWRTDFPDCTLFGKSSKTPAGTMTFSLLQKVPVVPFYGKRKGWFHHHLVFEPPLYLYEKFTTDQKKEAMDELSQTMEHLIRKVPEQWLYWFNVHERWEEGA